MNNEEVEKHLRNLSNINSISEAHIDYLLELSGYFYPKIIYDIGSCVLHWTKIANKIWPDSQIYLFEANDSIEFLYKETDYNYNIGVLSDVDNKDLIFYKSNESPTGNSYFKENSWATELYYGKESEHSVKTITLDTVVRKKNYPYPDLIKIDTQGTELDILKGMKNTLKYCKHLIIELQHSQYNVNAPLAVDSIPYIESLGFKLETSLFCNNGPDGDYHFIKN